MLLTEENLLGHLEPLQLIRLTLKDVSQPQENMESYDRDPYGKMYWEGHTHMEDFPACFLISYSDINSFSYLVLGGF